MFTQKLLRWHSHVNQRNLPWKAIHDPYKIWLSEIILQQTRAEQGLPYYERFITHYPTIQDLAAADEQAVFKLWQGLGYYNRCRNMLATAKTIVDQHEGVFPSSYEDIRALKGIGDYTAAAIASFAFKLPYAVVDGNVVRVLTRVFAMNDDVHKQKGKQRVQLKAQELLSPKKPDAFNQAMMDLGATICKPKNPLCDSCPVQSLCKAYQRNTIHKYPIKKVKIPLKDRYFHFFLPEGKKEVWLLPRLGKDIWPSLFTPLMVETTGEELRSSEIPFLKRKSKPIAKATQILSHQRIHGQFYEFKESNCLPQNLNGVVKVKLDQLKRFAFPRIIVSFFEKNNYL